jgi:alpha-2-macroglobulin
MAQDRGRGDARVDGSARRRLEAFVASASWVGLGVLIVLLGLACRPRGPDGSLDDPPVPDAVVVARLDPQGVAPWSQGPPLATPAAPSIHDFGPQGDVDEATQIYLRFDQAMKPPPAGARPLLRTEPAVEGTIAWVDAYQLVFSPVLESGRGYTVVVEGELHTADGRPMTLDQRWSIAVDRTAVELMVMRDDDLDYDRDSDVVQDHWKTRALVSVDRPATVAALRERVQVRGQPRGKPGAPLTTLEFRVRRPSAREHEAWDYLEEGSLFVVEPLDHWPKDSKIQIEVGAGFRATDDELGTGEAVMVELETGLGLAVKHTCEIQYEDGCDPGPVLLELSSPVRARQLRNVKVSPRPAKLEITGDVWEGGISEVVVNGRFEPGKRYTIELAPDTTDMFGQPLARPFREQIAFVLPAPELALSSRVGFLQSDEARTIGIESRWLQRVGLRVAVLDDSTTMSLLGRAPFDEVPFPTRGATVSERELTLDPKGRFGWSSVPIDLVDFIGQDRRAVFVEVTPLALVPAAAGRALPKLVRGLYQVTDLGALALTSSANATARVARLSTGEPLAGVEAQLFHLDDEAKSPVAVGKPGRSDARGLAPLPSDGLTPSGPAVMLVRNPDEDDRFVTWLGSLHQRPPGPGKGYRPGEHVQLRAVTERPLYRPGEKIRVVGWAAVLTSHTPSGLRPAPTASMVEIVLRDRSDDEVLRTKVQLEDYGKFWATLKLAPDAPLGAYQVEATLGESTTAARLRVEQFRTPAFAVEAAPDRGDYAHGATPRITVGASYYFGGRVPIAKARRHDECSTTYYRPPGLESRWVVGRSTSERPHYDSQRQDLAVDPSEAGRLSYAVDLSHLEGSWPYRCTSSVGVQDAAAAEVGAAATYMVHPARYLLLEAPERRLAVGDAVELHVRTVDHRAERSGGTPVSVEIQRSDWAEDAQGHWVEKVQRVEACTLETTATGDDPRCRVSRLAQGSYSVVARITDGRTKTLAEHSFWVGDRRRARREQPEGLTLELSDPEPKPGDTLTVTLRSPDKEARGLLTFTSGGLRAVEPFALVDGRYEHRIEVTDAWIPTREIEAVLVRPATATRTKLLERVTADVTVAHDGRRLQVEVTIPELASPRQTLPIAITLRDAAGEPTAGHVALWAVDEAILALAEPKIPDLVEAFIAHRHRETELRHDYDRRLYPYRVRADPYSFGYDSIRLGNIGTIGKGGGGGSSSWSATIGFAPSVRRNLETTPIFLGDVVVDESGHAKAEGTLPDDLTTFRVTAIASAPLVGGDAIGRFGHADARVRVTAPLVVQAALPRHLRPGDTAEVAALVDNLGGPAGRITVTLALDDDHGVVRLTSGASKTVHIDAGAQLRVPFGVKALSVGEPAFTLTAVLAPDEGSAQLGDALRLTVPVQPEPTLAREVAVYGSLQADEPVAVAVKAPTEARPGYGGLEVALGSTLLGGAEDMIDGLVDYPYGCVEQTASRMLPLAALGKLAEHYPLGVGDLEPWVAQGITRLRSMQTADGGLAYWPDDPHAHAYATAYATWVLQQLEDAGYTLPAGFMFELRNYLRVGVKRWAAKASPTIDDDIHMAMALVALAAGDRVQKEPLDGLYARHERLPVFGRALLLLALHAADPKDARVAGMADELLAGLDERDGAAHVRDGGRWLGEFFDSGPRTEAMVLLALLRAAPADRRVEKLTRGLLELRHAGAVRNTQERAYALLALAEYARRFEAEAPAFDTAVWVDADFIGRGRFEGRDAVVQTHPVPMPWAELQPSDDHRVTLSRTGQGRMYYRVAMRWAPDPATIEPHAAGIAIERTLRTTAGPVEAGDTIGLGELVSMDLTVTTNDAMSYVAIDIPLPAGLEAVDTSLGKGRSAMVMAGTTDGHWVSHRELRAERTLIFADRLAPGEHHSTVPLRAITPGRYGMPPAHAEAMYYPEVQGNTGSRIVEIR